MIGDNRNHEPPAKYSNSQIILSLCRSLSIFAELVGLLLVHMFSKAIKAASQCGAGSMKLISEVVPNCLCKSALSFENFFDSVLLLFKRDMIPLNSAATQPNSELR